MRDDAPPRYTVSRADFLTTASAPAHFPSAGAPEVAFFGRSNVGKSSLLNALVEQKHLAFTGKTPGRTRHINFFSVALKDRSVEPPRIVDSLFVDVPGYGFAGVSRAEKSGWNELLGSYVLNRRALVLLVLLVDGRREPQDEERWVVRAAAGRDFIIVLTKADKLSRSEQAQSRSRIASGLGISTDDVFVTSTVKERASVAVLRERIGVRIGGSEA